VTSAVRLLRGPAGRRAVIAAGMTGLLLTGVSAAERADPLAPQSAPAGAMMPTGKLAEVSVSRYTGALTTGMRLLGQAAAAGRTVAYRGVQVISWLTPGRGGGWLGQGTIMTTLNVLHQAGQPPDGALGLTPALVGLLSRHYEVLYTGLGSAAGRPASMVEVLRPAGSVAALFWLDKATALPLRRELFDDQARVISVSGFVGLTVRAPVAQHATASSRAGSATSNRAPAKAAPASPAATQADNRARMVAHLSGSPGLGAEQSLAATVRPWTDRLGPGQLAALRVHGWPAPAAMPGGLTLYDASESETPTGRVVDLAYSDGLSVVSLFVQRGRLPGALPGWRQTSLSGHPLFLRNPAEPDLTWSAGDYVYTVVAAAPAPILAGVVDALPHQARLGFWSRMGRGVRRLLSWANPFR
jgi:sigma-E factor negative regulatory protein RseB